MFWEIFIWTIAIVMFIGGMYFLITGIIGNIERYYDLAQEVQKKAKEDFN